MADLLDPDLHDAPDPNAAAEGSILAELNAAREALNAKQTEDFPLPGFTSRLWATYRLPRTSKAWGYTRVLADEASSDGRLAVKAADLIAHCTVGLWMRSASGVRVDFAGFSEETPAGWADLPESLVPPRPGGRAHDDVTRVRTLFNGRDTLVVMHAAEVAGWAQTGAAGVEDELAGEAEGGPIS